jgi:hypothetical protein
MRAAVMKSTRGALGKHSENKDQSTFDPNYRGLAEVTTRLTDFLRRGLLLIA